MLKGKSAVSGFTIIELLVAITILGVILGLGAPALSDYLQNAKVASATESLHAGIQAARVEAIRRNAAAQFILTDSSVAPTDAASAVPSATGQSWLVLAPNEDGSIAFIQSKAAQEGGGAASGAAVQIDASASGAIFAGSVVFNGFGGTSNNASYTFNVTYPNAGACVPTGPVRCRRVIVTSGGQVRACDPSIAVTATADTRHC